MALLDRVARAQVVEERPVREVDHLRGGAAQDAAAQQQVAQDRGGVALACGVGDGGQGAFEEGERGGLVHLGAAREHQGVGEALEEFGLVLGVEFDAVEAAHAPLAVAVGEDHLERGVVQGLAARREIAAARAVEGADHPAHEGVGRQERQVRLGAQGVQELFLVLGRAAWAACQRRTNAPTVRRPMGERDSSANPPPASQSARTAVGRAVSSQRFPGKARTRPSSQSRTRGRSAEGTSSRPSTITRPRPAVRTRSAQPSGGVCGQSAEARKAAGEGSPAARIRVRSGST